MEYRLYSYGPEKHKIPRKNFVLPYLSLSENAPFPFG